jgi:hypothetical protein
MLKDVKVEGWIHDTLNIFNFSYLISLLSDISTWISNAIKYVVILR